MMAYHGFAHLNVCGTDGMSLCESLTNSVLSAMTGSDTEDGFRATHQSTDRLSSCGFYRNMCDERNMNTGVAVYSGDSDESNVCFKPMEGNEQSGHTPGRISRWHEPMGGSPRRITDGCLQHAQVIRLPTQDASYNESGRVAPPHRINSSSRIKTESFTPYETQNGITDFIIQRESYSPQSELKDAIQLNAVRKCSPQNRIRNSTSPYKGAKYYSLHIKVRNTSPYKSVASHTTKGEYRGASPYRGAHNSSPSNTVGSGSPHGKVTFPSPCKDVTKFSTHGKYKCFPLHKMRSCSIQNDLRNSSQHDKYEQDSYGTNQNETRHNVDVDTSKQCISKLSRSPRNRVENDSNRVSFGEFSSISALDLTTLNTPSSPNYHLKYTCQKQRHNQNKSDYFERSDSSRQPHRLDYSSSPLEGTSRDSDTGVSLSSSRQPAEVLEALAEFENDLVFLSGCPNKISTPKVDKCSRLPEQKQWLPQRRSVSLVTSGNSTISQMSFDTSSLCTDNSLDNSSSSYCTSSLSSTASPKCNFDSGSSTSISYRKNYGSSFRKSRVGHSSARENSSFSSPKGIHGKEIERRSAANMGLSCSRYEQNQSRLYANHRIRHHSSSPLYTHYERRSLSHSPLVPRQLESDRAFLKSSSASKVHSNSMIADSQKKSVRRCLPFDSFDKTQRQSTTTTCRGDFLPERAGVEDRPFRRLQQSSDEDDILTSVDELLEVTNLFRNTDNTEDTAMPNGDNREHLTRKYNTAVPKRDSDTISSFDETLNPISKSNTPKPVFQTEDEEAVYYLITKYLENEDVKW